MAWWGGATRQALPRNYGGTLRPIAVTLHHQAGSGNPYNVYLSRGVSAHFWIPKSGKPVQHVDTARQAWHGVAHNGYSIGVETEGCGAPPHAEQLTQSQLNHFAELVKWANRTHGIPLVLSESVSQAGLNYHNCKGGPATGCPCAVRRNARSEILKRAKGGGSAPKPPSGGGGTTTAPKLSVDYFGQKHNPKVPDVRTWQQQMKNRGWSIGVDQHYGPQSEDVCRKFQREKGLGVDGLVGPKTWNAAWTAPVT